jgi:hypothetical protein
MDRDNARVRMSLNFKGDLAKELGLFVKFKKPPTIRDALLATRDTWRRWRSEGEGWLTAKALSNAFVSISALCHIELQWRATAASFCFADIDDNDAIQKKLATAKETKCLTKDWKYLPHRHVQLLETVSGRPQYSGRRRWRKSVESSWNES